MTRRNTLLDGHWLWWEGAPHDHRGGRIGWNGTGGVGSAKCSCGELSPVLPSGAARKRWHREHKAALAAATPKEDDR